MEHAEWRSKEKTLHQDEMESGSCFFFREPRVENEGALAGGEAASTCDVVSCTEAANHHLQRGFTSKDGCNSPSTNHQCKVFPITTKTNRKAYEKKIMLVKAGRKTWL